MEGMDAMKITADLLASFAQFNAGTRRAREAYHNRDVPAFEDCLEPRCGVVGICPTCRRRAKGLLMVATSEEECAELLAIIDRPGVRALVGCGSEAGYQRHRRRKQRPCNRCLIAHSTYCQRVRR